MNSAYGFATLAIHAGQDADPATGAVTSPIYQTSTYKQDRVGELRGGYEYSRAGNPTRTALEQCLTAIEHGTRAVTFSSGLAAEDCVIRTICTPGDRIIMPTDPSVCPASKNSSVGDGRPARILLNDAHSISRLYLKP